MKFLQRMNKILFGVKAGGKTKTTELISLQIDLCSNRVEVIDFEEFIYSWILSKHYGCTIKGHFGLKKYNFLKVSRMYYDKIFIHSKIRN